MVQKPEVGYLEEALDILRYSDWPQQALWPLDQAILELRASPPAPVYYPGTSPKQDRNDAWYEARRKQFNEKTTSDPLRHAPNSNTDQRNQPLYLTDPDTGVVTIVPPWDGVNRIGRWL